MKQTACTNDELWTIVMGGCHRAQIRPLFRLYMSRYKVNHNVNFKVTIYDLAVPLSEHHPIGILPTERHLGSSCMYMGRRGRHEWRTAGPISALRPLHQVGRLVL